MTLATVDLTSVAFKASSKVTASFLDETINKVRSVISDESLAQLIKQKDEVRVG